METASISDFKENTSKLLAFIEQVDAQQLLSNPSRDEWSIMDCCEHILQLEQALVKLFRGPVEKVPSTYKYEQIEIIKTRFLDFNRKLTAFGVIRPQRKYKQQEEISEAITETRKVLLRIGTNSGWDKKCTLYAHPLFGHLTRLEWLNFCTYHVERHLNQMKGILEILAKQKS